MRHRFLERKEVKSLLNKGFDEKGIISLNIHEINRIVSFVIGKPK